MINSFRIHDVGLQPVRGQSSPGFVESETLAQQGSKSSVQSPFTYPPSLSDETAIESLSQRGINWGEIFRNPLVDTFISEPAETLTTPDGYTLTAEGQRVVGCIAGQAVLASILLQIDPSALATAQALAPAMGCRPGNSLDLFAQEGSGNPLDHILDRLFGYNEPDF